MRITCGIKTFFNDPIVPVYLSYSTKNGRDLIAKRDFRAGDIVLASDVYALSLVSNGSSSDTNIKKKICHYCIENISSSNSNNQSTSSSTFCLKCGAAYCNEDCKADVAGCACSTSSADDQKYSSGI